MRKRFASFLLTGKTAALPFIPNTSLAQITDIPGADLLSPDVHLIQQPADGIRLLATTLQAPPPDGYGGGTAAELCLGSNPTVMRVVVTGVRAGETVFLVSSKDKDSALYRQFHPQLRIGATDILVLTHFTVSVNLVQQEQGGVAEQAQSAISIPVNLTTLSQRGYFTQPKFYLQAGAYDLRGDFMAARISELDEVRITAQACSSSGGQYP